MASDSSGIITLFVFFLGLALCMWRKPHGDRWHVALCVAAGTLWCVLPLFEPGMRSPVYGFIVAGFLIVGLAEPVQRRMASARSVTRRSLRR